MQAATAAVAEEGGGVEQRGQMPHPLRGKGE